MEMLMFLLISKCEMVFHHKKHCDCLKFRQQRRDRSGREQKKSKLVRKDRRILEAEGLNREAEMARRGAEATSTSGPQYLLDQVAGD